MKVLLEVEDKKAPFVLELLRNLRSVKVKLLPSAKETAIEDLKHSIKEVKLAKQGKIKLRPARELLNEL